jgi:hypothetical protein
MVAEYAPESSFGWLDLDAAASERVSTLLRALEEPGTLDPIGLGPVRDAFSGLLAPGTSTIQTRLRYFFFVPWICQRLEHEAVQPAQFAKRLREDEARLIDCLRHLGPNQGVLGYTAGKKLRRMPSEAYWGGLGSWGLRRLGLSIAEYARQAAVLGRNAAARDDDGNPTARSIAMWAPLPDPPSGFLAEHTSFELTLEEASVLVEHLRHHHPGSLLAVATGFPGQAAAAVWPWEVPPERLSSELREALRHARCLSELTAGPQHIYNLLLARRAADELSWDTSDLEERIQGKLSVWASVIESRDSELRAWVDDLGAFWAFLARHAQIGDVTVRFIEDAVRLSVADPRSVVDDTRMHGLIRDREIRLKGSRARLGSRAALENWNGQEFGGQLVYRWGTCRSYLSDIDHALQGRSTDGH